MSEYNFEPRGLRKQEAAFGRLVMQSGGEQEEPLVIRGVRARYVGKREYDARGRNAAKYA